MAASYAHKTSGQNFWLGDRGPFQPPGRPMAPRAPSFRGIWPSLQKLETLLFRHLHIIYLGLSSVLTLSHKHTLYLTLAHVHARTHTHVHVCTHTHAREALIDGSHEVISQNERNACKLFFSNHVAQKILLFYFVLSRVSLFWDYLGSVTIG